MDLLISSDKANTLTQLEHELSARGIGTVILFEGTDSMAMPHIVNQIVAVFEPRNIKYHSISTTDMPWIKYCLLNIATKGTISIFDRGWYSGIMSEGEGNMANNINLANFFERYLYNNGIRVIKIYLDCSESDMKKYNKTYPVDIGNEKMVFGYSKKVKPFSKSKMNNLIDMTNTQYANWDIVKLKEYKETVRDIADILERRFSEILKLPWEPEKFDILDIFPNPRDNVDFSKKISKKDYEKKLSKLQNKLSELQIELAESDKALVLAFEGWDAAGKGGCIKRVTQALNPRGYKTFPTPAPTAEEKAHTHLWRFAKNMPDPGKIAIFDRSWYGRMMVEPIEGFCTEAEYSRAAAEINFFESALYNDHVIILKFWIDITPEEQLERFNSRANDPLRSWKLTDEDWRNREKWDVYEKYINSMMKQTNTSYAPWIDVPGVDKRYARIKVLETIIETLEEYLE